MTKVIMNGCNGKMGQTITEICKADADIKIVAGIDLYDGIDNDYPVFSSIDKCDVDADVVIDFSNAKAVDGVLDYCVDKQVPVSYTHLDVYKRQDLGYEFLRKAISDNDYKVRGCDISADEIFVSDGAKSDSANIQELFSANSRIAVTDPVYPVYVDSNVMAGRTGTYDAQTETWSNVIYMPSTADNGFVPELPKEVPDMIRCV